MTIDARWRRDGRPSQLSAEPYERRSGRIWAILLGLLILAILLSPRLRLGELSGKELDLRVQDFLALPLAALALLAAHRSRLRLGQFWGGWLLPYVAYVATVSAVTLILSPELGELRQASFLARHLEVFFLTVVVAWLYLLAGARASRAVGVSLAVGIGANLLWVLFQVATGTQQTLLPSAGASEAQAYGPMLVGESSPFASGAMTAFAGVVAVSAWRVGRYRGAAITLIGIALLAAVVIESRASLLALVAVIAVGMVAPGRGNRWTTGRLVAMFVGALLLFVDWSSIIASLSVRYASAEWALSLTDRESQIWSPLVTYVSESAFFGYGPGALGGVLPYSEAHNIFLREVVDFGLVGLVLFVGLLASASLRGWRMQMEEGDWTAFVGNLAWSSTLCLVLLGVGQDSFTAVGTSHLWAIAIGVALGAFSARPSTAADKTSDKASVG